MANVSIIGIGRLGGALAIALDRAGHTVAQLVYRHRPDAEFAHSLSSDPTLVSIDQLEDVEGVVLICTGDPEIENVVARLADIGHPENIVLHTSGAYSSDLLERLRESGSAVGSMHPLVSVNSAGSGRSVFNDAYFCVEGDKVAVEMAEGLARSLGGLPFSIPTEKKTLYHAAAVMASGHLTTLIDTSLEMMRLAGVEPEISPKILLPLIKSTLQNIEQTGTGKALTGSFARADAQTVRAHLHALREEDRELLMSIYKVLGIRSLDIALANGADEAAAQAVRTLLSGEQ